MRRIWMLAAAAVLAGPAAAQERERPTVRPPATGSDLRSEHYGGVGVYRFVPVCLRCSTGSYMPVERSGGTDRELEGGEGALSSPSAARGSLAPFAGPEGVLEAADPLAGLKVRQEAQNPGDGRSVLHEMDSMRGPAGSGHAALPGDRDRKIVLPPGRAGQDNNGVIRRRGKPVIRYEGPAEPERPPRVWRLGPGFLIEG